MSKSMFIADASAHGGRYRIAIGKDNCKNDLPILINERLPEIQKALSSTLNEGNWESMKSVIERLQRVLHDLDDMAHEMNGDISNE